MSGAADDTAALGADLFGVVADAAIEGRKKMASAVAKDDAMLAAGNVVYSLARGLIASQTGLVGVTVADAAREIVEQAIRRGVV